MASPLHRTLCDGRAVRVKAAMRTVNDDAQTLHFSCSAHDGRGHPRTAASPISRDMLIGIHVLVVENSATTREMLRAAMEYCGAFVTLASSVAVAISAGVDGREHLREAGFAAFLPKPLDPFALAEVIAKLHQERRKS
jgi:hypothetical protein